jgi:hypothetical protein
MKSIIALVIAAVAAPGALAQVCGGIAGDLAVGILEDCSYPSMGVEQCSYIGSIWDTNVGSPVSLFIARRMANIWAPSATRWLRLRRAPTRPRCVTPTTTVMA